MSSVPESELPLHESRRLWEASGHDPVAFRRLESRRLDGEPLQYLEGSAAFGPFDVLVDERVLIPRPETEQLWELAQRVAGSPGVVVDLCTGSGALAIACKTTWPDAAVVATDLSPDALSVARVNVERIGVDVDVREGDLLAALPGELRGRVDLIVSNPPYVREDEWETLPADVRAEPRMALVAGSTGLEVLERIATESGPWLTPTATVICEMGEEQADAIRAVFSPNFEVVRIEADLTGRDRFLHASVPRV